MRKDFKYDVVLLIESVRDRPCIWDKDLENYKDRVERRAAWEGIFNILEPDYELMSPEDKTITGEHIINKWTNVRDTFVKTLKVKMGKPKRKYMYHDQLIFLTKVTPEDECPVEYNVDVPLSFLKLEGERNGRKRTRKAEDEEDGRKSQQSRDSDMDLYIDESHVPRVMNEDEAFFASLLPTVVKYSEDEKLEFRMEVLSIMKRLKAKRKWH